MLFYHSLLVVWLAVVIHLSSSERDCRLKDVEKNFLCHMENLDDYLHLSDCRMKDGHEHVLCRLGNLNYKLAQFGETQQENFIEVLRNLDRSIDKIHRKGPIAAALVDVTRVVGSVIILPYRLVGFILRDLLGLNRFWTMFFVL
jgi:hypothetical protein